MNLRKLTSFAVYPSVVLGGGAVTAIALESGFPDGVAVAAVTISAVLLVSILERLVPYEPMWNRPIGDASADAIHFVVNLAIKQVALAVYGAFVAHTAAFGHAWPRSWPLAAQALLAIVIVDASLYGVHRWSHSNASLWKLHAVHHSSQRLYWVNGERRHPLHQLLEGLPGVTAVMILGAPQAALHVAISTLGLNMLLQHGNIDYRAGWLRYVFAVAEIHRWHHRLDPDESRVNFGALFVVWDLVFGTYFNDRRSKRVREVGITEQPAVPESYVGQLAWPFRSSGRSGST